MEPLTSAAIDFAEAAYDLEASPDEWVPNLLQAGLPLLSDGLSVAGVVYARPPQAGPIVPQGFHVASGSDEFAERYVETIRRLPVAAVREFLAPGRVETLSERAEQFPGAWAHIRSQFDQEKDGLNITAVDPDGRGVHIFSALRSESKLSEPRRRRWQMLAAHVGAGYRLRRTLVRSGASQHPGSALPHEAEAVINPKDFSVPHAAGRAKRSVPALREAAIRRDRARGPLRQEPEKALEVWNALVLGRWSMADWFDADGRRFVLAIPNAPDVADPRGLTEREAQVATYAAFGHSNKFIAYELGISRPRVTFLLKSAMRKLGARTQAHLVRKLHDLGALHLLGPRPGDNGASDCGTDGTQPGTTTNPDGSR